MERIRSGVTELGPDTVPPDIRRSVLDSTCTSSGVDHETSRWWFLDSPDATPRVSFPHQSHFVWHVFPYFLLRSFTKVGNHREREKIFGDPGLRHKTQTIKNDVELRYNRVFPYLSRPSSSYTLTRTDLLGPSPISRSVTGGGVKFGGQPIRPDHKVLIPLRSSEETNELLYPIKSKRILTVTRTLLNFRDFPVETHLSLDSIQFIVCPSWEPQW